MTYANSADPDQTSGIAVSLFPMSPLWVYQMPTEENTNSV